MIKIYMVRHGETEWNKDNKTQGMKDIPLTDKGKRQAMLLAKSLSDVHFDKIYSSDLLRAYDTAKTISDVNKTEIEINKNFREVNFGKWEGMTPSQIDEYYPEEHKLWINSPQLIRLPGGETLNEASERASNALNKILDGYIQKNVQNRSLLIVAHSGIIKLLILASLGIDVSKYNRLRQDNTALNIVRFYGKKGVLQAFNDTHHLYMDDSRQSI